MDSWGRGIVVIFRIVGFGRLQLLFVNTRLRELGNYPSFIVRLSFVIRSFNLGDSFNKDRLSLGSR